MCVERGIVQMMQIKAVWRGLARSVDLIYFKVSSWCDDAERTFHQSATSPSSPDGAGKLPWIIMGPFKSRQILATYGFTQLLNPVRSSISPEPLMYPWRDRFGINIEAMKVMLRTAAT